MECLKFMYRQNRDRTKGAYVPITLNEITGEKKTCKTKEFQDYRKKHEHDTKK